MQAFALDHPVEVRIVLHPERVVEAQRTGGLVRVAPLAVVPVEASDEPLLTSLYPGPWCFGNGVPRRSGCAADGPATDEVAQHRVPALLGIHRELAAAHLHAGWARWPVCARLGVSGNRHRC